MITEGWQGQKSFWRARRREWKWDSVQQSGIVAPPAEFRERLCQFPGTRYYYWVINASSRKKGSMAAAGSASR